MIKRILQVGVLLVVGLALYCASMRLVEYVFREVKEEEVAVDLLVRTEMEYEWGQWRGPGRDGRSVETGLLRSWPEGGLKAIWRCEGLGAGWSSPTVAEGYIYITGTKKKKEWLACLDLSGQLRWKIPYGLAARRYPGARTTPAYDEGRVYVISGMGEVACIDAMKGMIAWKLKAYEMFGGEYGNFGVAESPLVIDDKVIYTPCGKQTTVVALDKITGGTIWQSESLSDVSAYVSPMVIERGGRKIIVTVTGSYIVGIDAEDGEMLWKYHYVTNEKNENLLGTLMANAVTPLYHDGQLYVTSGYGQGGIAFRLSEDGLSIEVVWEDAGLDCHHGGVVYHEGYIYGSNSDGNARGNWACIEWATGQVKYDQRWFCKGSIIYADGMLYCYEQDEGHLALVRARPDKFEVVSSFRVSDVRGENWAHPVICEGRLYVRYGDVLVAYDIGRR